MGRGTEGIRNKKRKIGDKRRVCKRKWAKGGAKRSIMDYDSCFKKYSNIQHVKTSLHVYNLHIYMGVLVTMSTKY